MDSKLLDVAEFVPLGNAFISLIGHGNIWIEDSLVDDSSVALTQSIIAEALDGTAAGQLELIVFDDELSGLAAPFWPLNSGGEKLLTIVHDEQDFLDQLRSLRDHVQGVKNVMQGISSTLVEFRNKVDYPVESYKLVVVSADFASLSANIQANLSTLLRSAPPAGVSFLIHSMTLEANPFILSMCNQLTIKPGVIEQSAGKPIFGWQPRTAQALISTASSVANTLSGSAVDPVAFADVQPLSEPWSDSSRDGVTFSIGTYGLETVAVTLGDELNQRHNMLVTGAVGQGKSNLINVIIHSLCQRYSPEELQLFLLDFKEGVALQPLAGEADGAFLPHARVLGLDADREFGLSLLQHLFEIYRSRMKLFKAEGVQNLRQYRDLPSQPVMPRIVVIIDEFQMMFAERDKTSDEIADLLMRGVRLFRACGIHIILASQTIGGSTALMGSGGEGLFGQVPIRIALKNSVSESHATLGPKNDSAAHLRARQAIVNLDYGDISANRKTSIAFADEQILAPLRQQWQQAVGPNARRPFVFNGDLRRSLKDDALALNTLVKAVSDGRQQPVIFLGSRVAVDAEPLTAPFGRDVGRNVAILGNGAATVELASIALSFVVQCPRTKIVILDCTDGGDPWAPTLERFVAIASTYGVSVQVVDKDSVSDTITMLAGQLTSLGASGDLLVIGVGLDRMRQMPMEFQDLVKDGPAHGTHFLGWWLKMDTFRDHVGYGGDAFFDIRLALKLDPGSAKQLMGDPLLDWQAPDNRMLAWDLAELPHAVTAIPYSLLPV